jgi:hypothetical protein
MEQAALDCFATPAMTTGLHLAEGLAEREPNARESLFAEFS